MRRDKALEAEIVSAVASWYDLGASLMQSPANKADIKADRDRCLEHLRDTFRQNERRKV
jgi:hypothetical protein